MSPRPSRVRQRGLLGESLELARRSAEQVCVVCHAGPEPESADPEWRVLSAVEGLSLLGGFGSFRLLERATSGLLYEVRGSYSVSCWFGLVLGRIGD